MAVYTGSLPLSSIPAAKPGIHTIPSERNEFRLGISAAVVEFFAYGSAACEALAPNARAASTRPALSFRSLEYRSSTCEQVFMELAMIIDPSGTRAVALYGITGHSPGAMPTTADPVPIARKHSQYACGTEWTLRCAIHAAAAHI